MVSACCSPPVSPGSTPLAGIATVMGVAKHGCNAATLDSDLPTPPRPRVQHEGRQPALPHMPRCTYSAFNLVWAGYSHWAWRSWRWSGGRRGMTLFEVDEMRKLEHPGPPTEGAADRSATPERVTAERWIRLAEVTRMTALGRSTIYKLSQQRRFPRPFRVPGTHAARWREAEVAAWMARVDGRAP